MIEVIEILNWDKFNPRKDVKNPSWFAFSNRLIEDSDFFDFSPIEFKAWIYLLSKASQKASAQFPLSFSHAEKVCQIPKKAMESTLDKLILLGICTRTSRPRTQSVQTREPTDRQTGHTGQDIHNSTDTTEARGATVDVHELFFDPIFEPFIEKVHRKVQDAWFATYPESDWVVHQMKEAVAWIHANPGKAPKTNYAKFFTSWLSRTWEWKRKNNQGGARAVTRANLEELA